VRQLETRLTPSLTTLASFFNYSGFANGNGGPPSGLIMDGSGNLYGTTVGGGASGDGTVFELPRGSDDITMLASFDGRDGKSPEAALVMDGSGNLYGTTQYGGASNDGTVFELAKGSGTITTLASFNGSDGAYPVAGLIMGGSGNLYGTTNLGGASNDGTVFELAAGSGTISTLASFSGSDGAYPVAGVVMGGGGTLYGTTNLGGASNDGTVFELAAGRGTVTTLASFNGHNGANPSGTLTLDSSGNLYGATTHGGSTDYGSVFELPKGSGAITKLASFNGRSAYPYGGVVMDGNGNLYGTTAGYVADIQWVQGTVFEVRHGSGTITTLALARGLTDTHTGLILDSRGNLYGAYGPLGIFELPRAARHGGRAAGPAAVTDQWTGANFAVDTNSSDGKNWSLGAPPTPAETAVFTNNSSVKSFTSTVDAGFGNPSGRPPASNGEAVAHVATRARAGDLADRLFADWDAGFFSDAWGNAFAIRRRS
jgi:uncharacterized repeat protein (TIGR03803 family)